MIDIAYLATGLVVGGGIGLIFGGVMTSGKVEDLTHRIDVLDTENRELRVFRNRVLYGLRRANAARRGKARAAREARQAKVIARHAVREISDV